jgi:hypothetical protein
LEPNKIRGVGFFSARERKADVLNAQAYWSTAECGINAWDAKFQHIAVTNARKGIGQRSIIGNASIIPSGVQRAEKT